MSSEVLRAKKICKSFYYPMKNQVLEGVDLLVQRGQTVAIMGRSGEGKSTLLQILGTLETPCSGEIHIGGEAVTGFNKSTIRNQKLSFIFQSFHLLEDYTAIDNVLMPAKIARQSVRPGTRAYSRGEELLEKVGLSSRANYHAKLLSGGEKQRVAIARALCNNPDLILADEPSGNLDRQTSMSIHTLLLEFVKEEQKALVVVTHDQELAKLCDVSFVLSNRTLHPFKF